MGCDIHCRAEKKVGVAWVGLNVEAFTDRNYRLFGWLAGVRNYSGIAPIAANRGFPSDAPDSTKKALKQWGQDAHSVSWVGVNELLAADYGQTVEDRRVTKQLLPGIWTGAETCEPGDGKKLTLAKFLDRSFFVVLKRLKDSGAERLVFWFDN